MRRSIFRTLAGYAVMGAALGAVVSLALIWIPDVPVASLVDRTLERWTTMLVVVCTLMATFGVDATLTGFLLFMVDVADKSRGQCGDGNSARLKIPEYESIRRP